jgi:hypothetical protein
MKDMLRGDPLCARLLIIGAGDLGQRLSEASLLHGLTHEVVLAGRDRETGRSFAALMEACTITPVRFEELDGTDIATVERLIRRENPSMIIQCASTVSPWRVATSATSGALALRSAGFAAQIPFQLPIIMNIMIAALSCGFKGPIINCSYPDLTNPVLARLGMAPTTGIGNVGMIYSRVVAAWLKESAHLQSADGCPKAAIRVLGHHSQAGGVMSCDPTSFREGWAPQVFIEGFEGRRDDLAFAGPAIKWGKWTNALTVASALPALAALLGGETAHTSLPGPGGLQGGYPVVVNRDIVVDLPPIITMEEAGRMQAMWARHDGLETIFDDGTILLTERAQSVLSAIDPVFARPLELSELRHRSLQLANLC